MQVRLFGFLIIFLCSTATLRAQFNRPVYDTVTTQGIRYKAELSGIASTSSRTPFWLRSNQFGTIPLESPAGIVSVGATGLWGDATQNRKPYFKASVEAVGNTTRNSRFVLPEAYAAVRLGHGELYVGRRKEINGITDTLLTSGSIAWSGNAIPITQIRLGTKDYAPLHFTKDIIAVNAFISHGWISDTDSMKNVLLHAKSLFIRIGKPNWKIKFYGGINHFVQWGGNSEYLDSFVAKDGKMPVSWKTYKKIIWPSDTDDNSEGLSSPIDTLNRVGNHLGSIDAAIEINSRKSNILLYTQHIWEDMSGVVFGNFPDGLFGIRWKNNTNNTNNLIYINQITAEFITTLNRSGTGPKGGDDYFFNGQYLDGWVHNNHIIGTPLFTRTKDIPYKAYQTTYWFRRPRPVNNNALRALHFGISTTLINNIKINGLFDYIRYYEWPVTKKSLNFDQIYSIIQVQNIMISRPLNVKLQVDLAFDKGNIFNSNTAVMVKLYKLGWLNK